MSVWLQGLDTQIFLLINRVWTHPWLDLFFVNITNLHHQKSLMYVLVPIGLAGWWLSKRKHAITVFFVLALTAALCDAFSYRALKPAVARPRPHHHIDSQAQVRVPYKPKSHSFPSNHAVTGFALARMVTWYHPGAHLWAWLAAGLVAYSRVYVGVHYPGDVIGGGIIGWLIATLLIKLVITRFYFLLPIYGYKRKLKK